MVAKRALIVGRSSAIRPGTFPSRSATRITAERRSRNRVGESVVLRSTTASTSAKVFAWGDVVGRGTLLWVLEVIELASSREFRGGPQRSRVDRR